MQNKSNRKRKRCNLSRFDKEINQAKEKKKGIKETQILNFLKCAPAFIGCFSEDEVRLLSVQTTPAYLIVNVDDSSLPGSHWIAIGIFDSRIEIFDTLGFNIFNWSRIPCNLLKFLHKFSQTREVQVLKRIQDDTSVLCGFYCIFYVVSRPSCSFEKLESLFGTDLSANDSVLTKYFS